MKYSLLLPILVLSSACVKQTQIQDTNSGPVLFNTQNSKDSSLRLLAPTNFTFNFSVHNEAQNLSLSSLSIQEMTDLALTMAENAFKKDDLKSFKIISLGTPIFVLSKEDRLNLKEWINSFFNLPILQDQFGELQMKLSKTDDDVEMEYFLVNPETSTATKIAENKISQSGKSQQLKVENISAGEVNSFAQGAAIYALRKGEMSQKNLFIFDGNKLKNYTVPKANYLNTNLLLIDPNALVKGKESVVRLFGKETDYTHDWFVKTEGESKVIAYTKIALDHDEMVFGPFQNTSFDNRPYNFIHFNSLLEGKKELHFKFSDFSRQRQVFFQSDYYSDYLYNTPDYKCIAHRNEMLFWKELSFNDPGELNFHAKMKNKNIETKVSKVYEYLYGKKQNSLKAIYIDIPVTDAMAQIDSDFNVYVADENAKQVSRFSGCMAEKYPQYLTEPQTYWIDYIKVNATYEYSVD